MNKLLLSFVFLTSIVLLSLAFNKKELASSGDWPEYLGGPDRNHYSELKQIKASNIN
ncbi:MAG: hypothetical protein JWR87_2516, partial [Segetibacter sp.]|nr:hypothetical protein [Segetibacter sp.]